MICCRCGADNYGGRKFCSGCGFALPQIPSGIEVRPATSLLAYLRSVKDDCLSGAMGGEELQAALARVTDHMERAREEFQARLEEAPEPIRSDPRKLKTLQAMEMFIYAVREMEVFLEDGDATHIEAGLSAAEAADMELQDSLHSGPDDIVCFRYSTLILPP